MSHGDTPAESAARRGGGEALTLIHTNTSPNPVSTRVSSVFAMPKEPWEKGYQAGLFGVRICPYEPTSTAAWAWSSGVIEGRAAREKSTR